jgi:hypothetical protein
MKKSEVLIYSAPSIVSIGAGGTFLPRRGVLQTLLVNVGCGGVPGLLPGRVLPYPGSPRQGSADPGLYYAALSGLVCGGNGVAKESMPPTRKWRGAVLMEPAKCCIH